MAGLVTPILSKTEFVARFRPLVGTEDTLTDDLLMAASNKVRRKYAENDRTLDESDPEVRLLIRDVVASVLRMGDFAGYSSVTITTDDATEARVLANPAAYVSITDAQWRDLGFDLTASPRGCFPVNDY
ncbi:hypothetical protein H7J86_26295 [Mycobacterium hackensackense]|uniref:hypothetical protein n=1 Tax=Mycobacterium hackensackense TaxID=228909 RepID=UPI002265BFAE|nr:hypothetical protein [Mycobacterium hackensackense]MCV7255680.1 hypothetical protein [Mycobacterium hackensackense]